MEANLAVLIDFENIAAGTEKEGLGRFDVDALMKRMKDKGRILVSRSYADWGRFARFKQTLLMNNVTMMELTSHGMQDKNRADIAMVVDCLDLAFTKSYIDTFVVVSGDSDFTPLVLKMRELNKRVIGCGTRSSTSRLLIQACDEFLFYDTIVKESRHPQPEPRNASAPLKEEAAFDLLVDALEGIQRENPEPAHASVVKTAVLRKWPDFNESDLGFPSFARFLEAAAEGGYVRLSRDQKGGGYRVDSVESGAAATTEVQLTEDRPTDSWNDPYTPEGATAYVAGLTKAGLNPTSHPTRLAILQALEESVVERRKRRRRITVPFVQDDVKKRLKKSHPDVPGRAVRAVFDALVAAGLLVHRDGKPIRSASAPFYLDRSAEKLNTGLLPFYLRSLTELGIELEDAEPLARLFLGEGGSKRDVEEAIAWMTNHPAEADEGPAVEVIDASGLDLDDLLHTEESAAPEASPAVAPIPEPVVEAVAPAEPAAEAVEPSEAGDDARPRRRRRTRTRRTKGEDALEAALSVDEE